MLQVVKADRPDLEEQKAVLTRQQNEYKILLKVSIDVVLTIGNKGYGCIGLVSKFRDLRTISCNV